MRKLREGNFPSVTDIEMMELGSRICCRNPMTLNYDCFLLKEVLGEGKNNIDSRCRPDPQISYQESALKPHFTHMVKLDVTSHCDERVMALH